MAHKKHQTGCTCCCRNFYHGGGNVRMVNLSRWDTDRYYRSPNDANFSNSAWCVDHYHQLIFAMGQIYTGAGTLTKIVKCPMKLPDARADLTPTLEDVVDFGVSYRSGMICTDSENEMVYYAVDDNPISATLTFRSCGFDGTGDATIFTRTKNASTTSYSHMEHCRANDRLYYSMRKSGDSNLKLYVCDLDGSNDALVYDPANLGLDNGSSINGGDGTQFCFDNTRSKVYACSRVNTSPYSGQIIRMDLDGSNQETVVSTGDYVAPYTAYGVYAVRFSHKDDKLFWFEGSNPSVTSGNSQDPDAGLFRADYDGANEEKLSGKFEFALGAGAAAEIYAFDLGCGYETLGNATLA